MVRDRAPRGVTSRCIHRAIYTLADLIHDRLDRSLFDCFERSKRVGDAPTLIVKPKDLRQNNMNRFVRVRQRLGKDCQAHDSRRLNLPAGRSKIGRHCCGRYHGCCLKTRPSIDHRKPNLFLDDASISSIARDVSRLVSGMSMRTVEAFLAGEPDCLHQ